MSKNSKQHWSFRVLFSAIREAFISFVSYYFPVFLPIVMFMLQYIKQIEWPYFVALLSAVLALSIWAMVGLRRLWHHLDYQKRVTVNLKKYDKVFLI